MATYTASVNMSQTITFATARIRTVTMATDCAPRAACETASDGSGMNVFHLFSKLPPELRLRIWNLNLPETRIVPIRCGSKSPSEPEPATFSKNPSPGFDIAGCTSSAPTPVNMRICVESRAEALQHYRPCFGFARSLGRILFNPMSDILFFGPRDGYMAAESQFHTCMTLCDAEELALVRKIAISDALFWIDQTYRSMTAASLTVDVIKQVAARMPNIQEMFFVPRDEDVDAEPAAVYERMQRQIHTAVQTICQQYPDWKPPYWRIVGQNRESMMIT